MKTVKPVGKARSQFVTAPEHFGALVRTQRTAAGLTIEDAALLIGVAKQTLQNVEKGTGKTAFDLILKIGAGLGVALLGMTDDKKSKVEVEGQKCS